MLIPLKLTCFHCSGHRYYLYPFRAGTTSWQLNDYLQQMLKIFPSNKQMKNPDLNSCGIANNSSISVLVPKQWVGDTHKIWRCIKWHVQIMFLYNAVIQPQRCKLCATNCGTVANQWNSWCPKEPQLLVTVLVCEMSLSWVTVHPLSMLPQGSSWGAEREAKVK